MYRLGLDLYQIVSRINVLRKLDRFEHERNIDIESHIIFLCAMYIVYYVHEYITIRYPFKYFTDKDRKKSIK